MVNRQFDVLVIGAGVSGLTTAVCLADAGLRVAIASAQPPHRTTSSAAGAIWGPHLVGIDERVAGWAAVTLARLRQMAGDPATGVRMISGIAASVSAQPSPPRWTDGIGERMRSADSDLPAGFASGWRFTAPLISMPAYLDYLLDRFQRAGGRMHHCAFDSLSAAATSATTDTSAATSAATGATSAATGAAGAPARLSAGVIVNCSGIGARDLVPDPAVQPVRGQVVAVANPGITEFFIGIGDDPDHPAYLFPHEDRVVLGGTEQAGDWNQQPDPATSERILRECAAIEPKLIGATVLAHKVGIRPVRPEVRLEAEDTGDGRPLLHNYGHGGAGVTLSWGCAIDVTKIVLELSR